MNKLMLRLNGGHPLPKLTAQKMTLMSVVIAARIILSYVPGINIGNIIEFGVGFVGAAFSGILFGPIYALIVSVINDLITFFLNGSGFFFPGFTLSAALGGWIYGMFFWRKTITWQRVLFAVLTITIIVNILLNSLWIRMMFGQAWMAIMPLRIGKNLVSLPFNTILLVLFFKSPAIERLIHKHQF